MQGAARRPRPQQNALIFVSLVLMTMRTLELELLYIFRIVDLIQLGSFVLGLL